ncbi:MAG TPA: MMPL family transporter, partial [Acidimicrobiales bacterium]|nr:MMPL family transporter [Acidimicrobiales bacterium]
NELIRWSPARAMPDGARPSTTVFGVVGQFSVRHRWWVIGAWVLVAATAIALLPTLGEVVNNDTTAFLPSTAPSVRAQNLIDPLTGPGAASGVLVAATWAGPLTGADQAGIDRIEAATRALSGVTRVTDGPVSADGESETADVDFASSLGGGGRQAAQTVGDIRSVSARLAPPGLAVYLSGSLPVLVDQQQAGSRTANHVALLSGLFILLVLLVAFRSTLAPLITLAPAALSLAIASRVIAESTKVGVQISSLLLLLLTALVLGAGTDYGLFLIFRYRENLRAGLEPTSAIVAAVDRVGQSIASSAFTVIAALLTLLLASFGLYRGVGPGLAIGVGIVLVVELTFFPALLAVLGRAVFWPSVPRPGEARGGRWGVVAARVSTRPALAVAGGVLVCGALALGLVDYAPSGFNPGGAIPGSNSADGLAVLEQHFGPSALGVTDVVFEFGEPVWTHPEVLLRAQEGLLASSDFSSVDGALDASGTPIAPSALEQLHAELGPPQLLPPVDASASVGQTLYDAYRSTGQYVTADGRTVVYRVSLTAGSPGTTAALQAIPGVRTSVAEVAGAIGASSSGVAGQAAGAADVAAVSGHDVVRIAPLVLVILGLILAVVLRSLVAPVYLVLSVALSYLASLGLTVLLFVDLDRQLGINFTLPFFMFVFIMALGEDYNILVMSRIREEAARTEMRTAVADALSVTGTTVTSAGLVLAGTFAVLAISTSGQIRQIGTGLAFGILLDTFVVRTLLVPSTAVLLGRWNWWPSPGPGRAAGSAAVWTTGNRRRRARASRDGSRRGAGEDEPPTGPGVPLNPEPDGVEKEGAAP